jgi:hypothetical protein
MAQGMTARGVGSTNEAPGIARQGLAKNNGVKRMQALGRLKVGAMNKTEAAYAEYLRVLQHSGAVLWFKFEGVKLRLADNCFYSPDFAVMFSDGALEMHEVNGHWQDDARVKIKVASELYPFKFVAVKVKAKKNGGGWESEVFE